MGDGKDMDTLDSWKKIGRVLCKSTKAEGYTGNANCLTDMSLRKISPLRTDVDC